MPPSSRATASTTQPWSMTPAGLAPSPPPTAPRDAPQRSPCTRLCRQYGTDAPDQTKATPQQGREHHPLGPCTTPVHDFVAAWKRNAAKLSSHGLYDPAEEHDACGVGLVASLDGTPRRDVVVAGIEALKAVWHRGAVDADGKTGDGAGIHLQIPQDFFREHVSRTGHEPGKETLAVGMVFLPRPPFRI